MREVKHTVPMYSFYDRTGIQNYLQEQAAKGWMLDKAGTIAWRFRRTEPKKLKFSVVYFPEADLYDPAPGEGEQTFREFCEHSGWHFASSQAQMLIFYNESSNPVPIDTDPVIEVENIHKSMKKSSLLGYWLLMISAVLQIVSQSLSFTTDPVRYLSLNINLYFIIFWPSMLLMCAGRIFFYYRWHRRAKRAAENGEFLATRGFQRVEAVWGLISMAGLLACAVFGYNKVTAAVILIGIVVGLGLISVSVFAREYFINRGYAATQIKVRTIIVTVVATLILSAVVTSGAFYMVDHTEDTPNAAIEMSDFMDAEYGTLELENSESILLGRQRIMQYTTQKGPITELQYQVLRIKADFLYDFCRADLLRDNHYELAGWDAAPWSADEAYAFMDDDQVRGYLLYYGEYIVTIWPEWEMTAEQMAMVGEKFG